MGADRYMVHEVIDLSAPASASAPARTRNGRLIDGTPLVEELEQILCDCSVVAHVTVGGEPLELGRKTKVWNTAQRRAITVRDGARCRFPGCRRTIVDIHHLRWWSRGGPPTCPMAVCAAPGTTPCSTRASTPRETPTTTSPSTAPTTP